MACPFDGGYSVAHVRRPIIDWLRILALDDTRKRPPRNRAGRGDCVIISMAGVICSATATLPSARLEGDLTYER
jgi:hypothetical protein